MEKGRDGGMEREKGERIILIIKMKGKNFV